MLGRVIFSGGLFLLYTVKLIRQYFHMLLKELKSTTSSRQNDEPNGTKDFQVHRNSHFRFLIDLLIKTCFVYAFPIAVYGLYTLLICGAGRWVLRGLPVVKFETLHQKFTFPKIFFTIFFSFLNR